MKVTWNDKQVAKVLAAAEDWIKYEGCFDMVDGCMLIEGHECARCMAMWIVSMLRDGGEQ